jgi:hypothetical protein
LNGQNPGSDPMVNTDIMRLEGKINTISDDVAYLMAIRPTTPKTVMDRMERLERMFDKDAHKLREMICDQDTAILRLSTKLKHSEEYIERLLKICDDFPPMITNLEKENESRKKEMDDLKEALPGVVSSAFVVYDNIKIGQKISEPEKRYPQTVPVRLPKIKVIS